MGIFETDDAVHPTSLDHSIAFQLQTQLNEERNSSLMIVDTGSVAAGAGQGLFEDADTSVLDPRRTDERRLEKGQ